MRASVILKREPWHPPSRLVGFGGEESVGEGPTQIEKSDGHDPASGRPDGDPRPWTPQGHHQGAHQGDQDEEDAADAQESREPRLSKGENVWIKSRDRKG